MTAQQISSLNIGIDTNDARAVLTVEAALEWIAENTTIDADDLEHLPSSAKLFILKYLEITNLQAGVTSESIEGLSQSFGNGNQTNMIWDAASDLLGAYLKSRIRFVTASPRWGYGFASKGKNEASEINDKLGKRLDGVL